MKILVAVPGNLRTVPTIRYVPEALRALGHEVPTIDYSLGLGEKLRARLTGERSAEKLVAARLLAAIEASAPELFVTLYGFNIGERVLEALRARGIPSANWWLNDPFQWERGLPILARYDFAFTNARYSVDAYRAAGLKNVAFLPTACAPAVHRPVEAAPSACDVSFAGDWSPLREQLAAALIERGIDLRVFGPWRRKLARRSPVRSRLEHGFFSPQRMVEIFARCRATLNVHTWRGRFDYGLNPRVFEAGACGTPQLVDQKRELDEILSPAQRAGMLVYRSDEELFGLAGAVHQRADALKAAALGAAASFRREHSYEARMLELLRIAGAAR
jgi:spore maturation protein CgeB